MTPSDQEQKYDLEEALGLLQATPGALRALLADLPDAWLAYAEDPDAWSPRTVLVHFIHNDLTNWMPRARVVLSGERRFPPFRQLPELSEYQDRSVPQLLAQFATLREENIAALRAFNLAPADYDRPGEHPVLGAVNLGQLLATWVVHDLNHLHQIAKTLAKRYRDLVGPWRTNLPILDL